MPSENVTLLSSQNFETEVLNGKGLVIVDFYADWCGPCKMLGPIFDELADEFAGKVKFCKANIDQEKKLAIKFKVMSIPTLLFYKDGEQVNRVTGALSKSELLNHINKIL